MAASRLPSPGRLAGAAEQAAWHGLRRGSRRIFVRAGDLPSRTLRVVDVEDVDRLFVRRYLLTPTMTSSPRSMRAWRRAAASSMRSLGMPASTALVMPPSASTSSISARPWRPARGQAST
jgi:hypothetical protein